MTVVEETRQIQATNEVMLAKGKAEIQVLKAMLTTVQTQLGLAEEEEDIEEPHISQSLITNRLQTFTSDDWHAQQLAETQSISDAPASSAHNVTNASSRNAPTLPWSQLAIAVTGCGIGILLGLGMAGFLL